MTRYRYFVKDTNNVEQFEKSNGDAKVSGREFLIDDIDVENDRVVGSIMVNHGAWMVPSIQIELKYSDLQLIEDNSIVIL